MELMIECVKYPWKIGLKKRNTELLKSGFGCFVLFGDDHSITITFITFHVAVLMGKFILILKF